MEAKKLHKKVDYDHKNYYQKHTVFGQSRNGRSEYKVVTFAEIFGNKSRTLSFQVDYELIQRLREIKGLKARDYIEEQHDELPSLEEAEKALIQEHIEEYRPDTNWAIIAEKLGTTKKTLYKKRKKYDLD